MNRSQRKAHAGAWPFIALVLLAVIGAALTVKHRVASASDAAQQTGPR